MYAVPSLISQPVTVAPPPSTAIPDVHAARVPPDVERALSRLPPRRVRALQEELQDPRHVPRPQRAHRPPVEHGVHLHRPGRVVHGAGGRHRRDDGGDPEVRGQALRRADDPPAGAVQRAPAVRSADAGVRGV
eukprot:CAMPEP_0194321564 /NCGR_PEP_ID=MMETSP0171-20130528/17773_1 /TAXON_ID=218684 /ORGANISM="Corethron pennatum, Strain L29A3" /LENGTH=132 /DNA_ID=CAMNT_0039079509 /DNA_START=243 /DNA_END=642 /DNA_ORIENTATION=-